MGARGLFAGSDLLVGAGCAFSVRLGDVLLHWWRVFRTVDDREKGRKGELAGCQSDVVPAAGRMAFAGIGGGGYKICRRTLRIAPWRWRPC